MTTDTRPPNTPYVNLNGSSRESLCEDRLAAWRALQAAMKAFQETRPNGRDYQCAPRGAYEAARDFYEKEFAKLDAIANTVKETLHFLMDEGDRK